MTDTALTPVGAMSPRNKAYAGMALAAVALFALPFVAGLGGNSWIRILDFALLYAMLALGLNIVVGFAGLLDLGYIAFYAVGAYLAGLLASPQFAIVLQSFVDEYPAIGNFLTGLFGPEITQHGIHLSVWIIVPFGAALAAGFGVVLGAPTLKLRGDYLAIVTLGFGEMIRIFLNNLNAPVNLTNGPQGVNLIDPVSIGSLRFNQTYSLFGLAVPPVQLYYYLFLVLVIVIVFVTIRLQDSRIGRAWVAIREDEIAAKAMGINTRNIKLLAFAMGASFGGVSGTMFGAFQGFVSPESFVLPESILILSMVVLGGMGHIPGVILGAVLLSALPEVLRHAVPAIRLPVLGVIDKVSSVLPSFSHDLIVNFAGNLLEPEVLRQLIFGLAMVVVMLKRPAGLWPAPEHGRGLHGIKAKRSAAEGA
jgi:branched-chain amino acid transport system permease protein